MLQCSTSSSQIPPPLCGLGFEQPVPVASLKACPWANGTTFSLRSRKPWEYVSPPESPVTKADWRMKAQQPSLQVVLTLRCDFHSRALRAGWGRASPEVTSTARPPCLLPHSLRFLVGAPPSQSRVQEPHLRAAPRNQT